MADAVNHPAHYGGEDNPYECVKVIEAWNLNFRLGNAVKYIGRPEKGDYLEDLKKARWYLDREIRLREEAAGVNREESSQLPVRALKDRGSDYWRAVRGEALWSCWFQGKKPPPGKALRNWTRDEVAAAWGPITEVTNPEEVLPWD
jgi:hypothetical protein